MSMWAIVSGGTVQLVLSADPSANFHPSLIKVCPEGTLPGDKFDGTNFAHVVAPAPTLADRLAALSAERYARQVAGVYFQAAGAAAPSLAASDPGSTAMMTSSFVAAQGGHWVDGTPWKMADGSFVPLKAADMAALALAVMAYVAACFAREAQLAAALATDLATDITQGWPSSGSATASPSTPAATS